ncbi:MAG: triose-phosphate isomerase, partial [Candidatus Hadarchaeales archaeon]
MRLEIPAIVVNFKTYREATGGRALQLAKLIQEVGREHGVAVAVCPQATDIAPITREVEIPVLAQHADPAVPGKNTGWTTPYALKEAGAVGTLLNHAEHKIPLEQAKKTIEILKSLDLLTLACAADVEESKRLAALDPEMVAVEPPELIGTGIPVSKAKPEVVSGSVEAVKKINPRVDVLCGAGIVSGDDVRRALELGSAGVLLASGIVCAKDQRAA